MPNPEKDKTPKKKTVSEELLSGIWDNNAPTETAVKPKPVNGKPVAETKTVSSQLLEGIFDGNGQIKKKVSGNESDVSSTDEQVSPSVSGNTESISDQPTKPQPNSVFSLLGKGLNYIQGNLVNPIATALSDVEQKVKDKILQSPELLSKFKKDVQTHYDDKIGKETSYAGGQYNLSNVPVVSDRGRELVKERDNYLKELDDNAAILVGGLTPVETKYLDENGKTKYKTEYVKNETVLPVNYKPLDPKPDINIEISKMGNIGKELMKITNPTQAEQLDANATPYLQQQAQYMGVTARAKYLKSELDKKVETIKNNPVQAQALNDYIEGKANTDQIDFLVKSGVKPLYDEYNGLSNLSTEITHANPAIREGFLKKAIFNELNNRYGSSNGFLGTQGWNEEQLNTVVNDYKKKLTDPRDLKLLDNISEQKELGSLIGDNQSWAAQMAKQFYGTLWNTGKYISNDLLAVDIPNIINPENRDNRNKEQQLTQLKEADADKSNVTIDFKPDKKQFFLKQYVDTNPESETFLQTKENKGEMDGSFADKVLYNSAAQFGQLGAQIAMASALPTVGRITGEGFVSGLDKIGAASGAFKAASGYNTAKSLNFINKVALPAFAMTYDSNYKQSFDVVGTKDVWKNNLYATLNSSFEGATELLGNPLEQAKFLTSAFKKDIGNFVKNLSLSELQKMGQEGFKEKVKNIALESLKGLGRGAIGAAGESNEEALNDILTGTTQAIFNPNYTTASNVIQQAGQTWLETFAGMGFMPATGVVSSARSGWGSKLSQDALTFIAQNKQAAIENINQSVADKTITQDESNQKIHLVNTATLAHEQSQNAAIVQKVTTGKKISKSNLAALTMARANEIELDNQISEAKKTNDVALEVTLEDKKNQYVEIRKSLINDEMWIDPITGTPEVPPIAEAPEPQQISEDELQPNEPVTVPKIKAVKGQNEEQAKAFDTHKTEANNWLENENTRLRNIFGKIPFKDFKKEYDTVKDTYLKKIGEAVTLSQTKTESDGKSNEAQRDEETQRQNEVLTQASEGATGNLVPSDLKNEQGKEQAPASTVAANEIKPKEGFVYRAVDNVNDAVGNDKSFSNKINWYDGEGFLIEAKNSDGKNIEHHEGAKRGSIKDEDVTTVYYEPDGIATDPKTVERELVKMKGKFPSAKFVEVESIEDKNGENKLHEKQNTSTVVGKAEQQPSTVKSEEVVYHGGDIQGDFDASRGDFGIHFGTKEQAENRLGTKDAGNVKPYTVDLKNPIQLSFDMGWWKDIDKWKELGYIPENYDGDIITKLKEDGYDGIIYPNNVEGEGTSYIVFDKSSIKEVKSENKPIQNEQAKASVVGDKPSIEVHAQNIKDKFRQEFKAKGNSDEHIDGALALMDARAKSWASEEKGRTPDEWYNRIIDVKSGEFLSDDIQYQFFPKPIKKVAKWAAILSTVWNLNAKIPNKLFQYKGDTETVSILKSLSSLDMVYLDKEGKVKKEASKIPSINDSAASYVVNLWAKSGYPKISIEKGDGRSYYNPIKNEIILKLSIKQADSVVPEINDNGEVTGYGISSGLVFAELSHALQAAKGDLSVGRSISDFLKANGDYEKTYNKKGTVENDAHSIIQKDLVEGFNKTLKFQNQEGITKGALETLKDGRVVIHALEKPDFSTMVHEIGHIFEKDLTSAEQKIVKDFGGSEPFARGFERYLRDGKAPTEQLKTLFDKFKTWLTDIYKSLKGSAIEKKVSPEIKQIFDRLLTEQNETKAKEKIINKQGVEGSAAVNEPIASKESSVAETIIPENIQQTEQSKIGGQDALQISSADAVLQRQQEETGKAGSERSGVEQQQQGKEATEQGKAQKEIAQKGKELADKIRSLRPKKGETAQATIFALPIAIYDTAIVTIANAVELTGDLAQAINEGVKYIQSQVSDWKDKDGKFEQHINDFVEGKKPKITAQTTDEDVAKPKEETDKKKESNEKRANTNELNKLATDIVGIDEVKKYLSGKTIEKHTGEKPTNPQEYISTDLQKAFEQGENIIEKAKALFGDKYVSELLDYLNRANISIAAKSLVYVSLANDLYKEKKAFPERFEEITKLQFMVNRDAQAFAHDVSVALGLRRLQNLQLYGADTSDIENSILTPTEQEQKNELEDSVQADDSEVNKEFEQQENNEENVTETAETAKDVEQDKKDKKSKKDPRKKTPKSQWKAVTIDADALKQKMDEIKNKINKLDC